MDDKDCLRPEFRGILDEFTRVRNAYVALKAYCESLEEVLAVEKERAANLKDGFEKMTKTCMALEKRHKFAMDQAEKERNDFREMITELEEQCDHLRLVNLGEDPVSGPQDEAEVLKATMLLQEEKHNEEISLLNQRHADEIQRYKVLLQNAKLGNSQTRKRRQKNTESHKKNESCFRWPELDIEKVSSTPANDSQETEVNENKIAKRRKLFFENNDAEIDV